MEFESSIKHVNSWLSNQYNVPEPYLTFDENSIGGNHFSPGMNVINITSVDEFKNPINKREACWIFLHEYRHYLQYLGKVPDISLDDLDYRKKHILIWSGIAVKLFIINLLLSLLGYGYYLSKLPSFSLIIFATFLFGVLNLLNCIVSYRIYYHFAYNNKFINLCFLMEKDADNFANRYDSESSIERHLRFLKEESKPQHYMDVILNKMFGNKHLLSHPTTTQRLQFANELNTINQEYLDFINSIHL